MFFYSQNLFRYQFLIFALGFALSSMFSNVGLGQSIAVFESQVKETIQRVETFHVRVAQINTSVNKQRLVSQKRNLYNKMAVSYTHLTLPTTPYV